MQSESHCCHGNEQAECPATNLMWVKNEQLFNVQVHVTNNSYDWTQTFLAKRIQCLWMSENARWYHRAKCQLFKSAKLVTLLQLHWKICQCRIRWVDGWRKVVDTLADLWMDRTPVGAERLLWLSRVFMLLVFLSHFSKKLDVMPGIKMKPEATSRLRVILANLARSMMFFYRASVLFWNLHYNTPGLTLLD